jgi:CheY-like chemotaxis protein
MSTSHGEKTVLIVDDNPTGRELSEAALKPLGCALIFAEDGEDALGLIRSRRPDLVLLDLRMPILNGYALMHKLRSDPENADLCVVALTACAMNGDREKAMALGFSGFITKPFALAAFRYQIREHLNRKAEAGSDEIRCSGAEIYSDCPS